MYTQLSSSTFIRNSRSGRVNRAFRPGSSNRGDGRTLFLVDLENLAGNGRAGPEVFLEAAELLAEVIDVRPGDQMVVGCDAANLLSVDAACQAVFGDVRRVIGHGPDGADPTTRPNQIFTVSLPASPLSPERQRRVPPCDGEQQAAGHDRERRRVVERVHRVERSEHERGEHDPTCAVHELVALG